MNDHQSTAPEEVAAPATIPQSPVSVPVSTVKKRLTPGKIISSIVLLILLCGGVSFGGAWLAMHFQREAAVSSSAVEAMVDANGATVTTAEEEQIARVAEVVSPSVVSIVTTVRQSSRYYSSEAAGAGTGVIVSKDGYIMTNNHVINGATSVSVVQSDGTQYDDVEVIGKDPLNDIAFLKVSGVSDLPVAQLGDSSKVRIGQRVVAIGNALGQFQNTVTSGIISATGRPLVAASSDGSGAEQLTDLLQTDAAINSGNSGGPLVDLSGRVIGINTAIAADANGIGFAIPINATTGVLKGVLESGTITRAYLGVSYVDITPEVASTERLSVKAGAYVSGTNAVVRNGPADKAGVKTGDVITKVNDYTIGSQGSMSSIIGQYQPGDTVRLTIVRDGKEQTMTATLTEYTSS